MELEDQVSAEPDDQPGKHDQKDARQHLAAEILKGGERGCPQSLQGPVFSVADDDVADAPEGGEHHVHRENARHQPIDVAYLRAAGDGAERGCFAGHEGREIDLLGQRAIRG